MKHKSECVALPAHMGEPVLSYLSPPDLNLLVTHWLIIRARQER